MDLNSRADLQGLKVISFESRRAVEIAELIRRYGGDPFVAPSMREVPLEENRAALELIPELEAGEPRPADSHDRRRHQDSQPGFVNPIFARANHCSDAACKVGGARAEAGSRSERVDGCAGHQRARAQYLARSSLRARCRGRSSRKANCGSGIRHSKSGIDVRPSEFRVPRFRPFQSIGGSYQRISNLFGKPSKR